jgi:uncharacterized protein involved in exopolysaccharide biosynthesis
MRKMTQVPADNENTKDLSLRDLIAPLFRRKRLILVTFFSILILTIVTAAIMGPSYSSRMAILVNRERLDPLVSTQATTQLITADNPVTAEEINSEVELLQSRDVLEKVVVANHLDQPGTFSITDFLMPWQTQQDRHERAVKKLAKKLKIEAVTKTNLIEISYKSPDPNRSYAVLKSLADFYMSKHVSVHRPVGSYEFFAAQTDKYHKQLEDAETKLRRFGSENQVAAPEDQKSDLANQVADSVGILHLAEQQVAADQQRIASDRAQMRSTEPRSVTLQASAANDKLIEDLNASLLAAQLKRTQLAAKFAPSYPLVREADEEIAQASNAVQAAEQRRYVTETTDRDPTFELLREDIAKTQADLSAQQATLAATRHSIASIQGEMVRLDQLSISQQDLQREAKADESNYLIYMGKREEELTSNALDSTRIANVAIAVPPAIPVLPVLSWPLIILIALGSAMVLSVAMGYTVDHLDSSFHTPAEVIDILGIPVVVTVSRKRA